MILMILLAAAAPPAAVHTDGIAMAKRLTAAIKGEAEYQAGDFARPLEPADKAALHQFARCKVSRITYMLTADPNEPNTYFTNRDEVLVGFNCKGVPSDSPAAISLYLKDGKIATIETHNADLMKAH
ncbi:MAG TPA: hypothetical protein VJM15_06010 [Sphingomicrobium sp.]|nr:hypothetical protein [Sphingomicrobium sp.]